MGGNVNLLDGWITYFSRSSIGQSLLTPGFQNNSVNTTKSAEERVSPILAAVKERTATDSFSENWNS